jgi:hypothetical protein
LVQTFNLPQIPSSVARTTAARIRPRAADTPDDSGPSVGPPSSSKRTLRHEVAVTLAGFSGVAVVFRLRGAHSWSPTELRFLWLVIGDSFLVLFFSLLPFPLAIANWSDDALWGICNALLGSWFIVGDVLALRGERRDRIAQQLITVPVITLILYVMSIGALAMGIALWLSAWDLLVPRGQAAYVLGLIALLAFAAVEFLSSSASSRGKAETNDAAIRRSQRRGGRRSPID